MQSHVLSYMVHMHVVCGVMRVQLQLDVKAAKLTDNSLCALTK